jgi:hypothetical protein
MKIMSELIHYSLFLSIDSIMYVAVLGSDGSFNQKWQLRESHNCYSYLLNLKSTEAERLCMIEYEDLNYCRRSQPGYAAGYDALDKKDLSCPEVMKRTLADNPNIKPADINTKCDFDSYKGALVVDPGTDYHYYRLNDEGYWTHKPGYKPSTAYDASGNLIYNPEKANRNYGRLNYKNFCGYFCVPRQPTRKRMYHKPTRKIKSKPKYTK